VLLAEPVAFSVVLTGNPEEIVTTQEGKLRKDMAGKKEKDHARNQGRCHGGLGGNDTLGPFPQEPSVDDDDPQRAFITSYRPRHVIANVVDNPNPSMRSPMTSR